MQLATSNNAIFQDYKLYIEGEECPFVSASITYGVSVLPEMTIQLVPFKILRNLGERTRVHLYFIDPVDRQQRLLFDGEISGVGYTKNPSSQLLTYAVSHVSRYFDEILLSFFDLSAYAMSIPPLYVESSGAQLSLDYSSFEYSTLEKLFKSMQSSGEFVLFQDLFKSFFDKVYETKNATIDYYKGKMDEWNLVKRISTLPAGSKSPNAVFSLKSFLDNKGLFEMFRNEIRRLDGMHSVFRVFREVFGQIFYYPVVIPTAYLYTKQEQILQTIFYKPQSLFVLPPSCNVIWPSMYNTFSYSRNFKSIPTRQFARLDPMAMLRSSGAQGVPEYAVQYVWSPEEVRDGMERVASKSKAIASGRAKGRPSRMHKMLLDVIAEKEEEVGIKLTTPNNNGLFVQYVQWLKGLDVKNNEKDEMINALLDYELTRQQFETSLTTISMVFNPYLVPGFPCLIMDRPESGDHVYGYVTSVSHTITEGNVGTLAEIAYIRQYDEPIVNKFFIAEDVWENEDDVYQSFLGVPSIRAASFNTIKDEKKRGDVVEIPIHLEETMGSGGFYDYVYNAYARSYRPVIAKGEYDSFVKDLKYDSGVQEKVRKYRSWVTDRVAVSDYDDAGLKS